MSLEQIKTDIVDAIDKAWSAVADTADTEAARAVAADLTSRLSAEVLRVEAHLFNHVADNANQPAPSTTAENPAAPAPAAPVEQGPGDTTAQPSGPAEPAEPVTGMAPAAGDPSTSAPETTPGA